MEPDVSLSRLQVPANCPYPEPNQPSAVHAPIRLPEYSS